MFRAEIRPLAKIRFGDYHRSCGSQSLHQERILFWRRSIGERKASSRRLHFIGGVDIVFDDYRDAMKGPARLSAFSFAVHCIGDGQSIGIYLDDRVKLLV